MVGAPALGMVPPDIHLQTLRRREVLFIRTEGNEEIIGLQKHPFPAEPLDKPGRFDVALPITDAAIDGRCAVLPVVIAENGVVFLQSVPYFGADRIDLVPKARLRLLRKDVDGHVAVQHLPEPVHRAEHLQTDAAHPDDRDGQIHRPVCVPPLSDQRLVQRDLRQYVEDQIPVTVDREKDREILFLQLPFFEHLFANRLLQKDVGVAVREEIDLRPPRALLTHRVDDVEIGLQIFAFVRIHQHQPLLPQSIEADMRQIVPQTDRPDLFCLRQPFGAPLLAVVDIGVRKDHDRAAKPRPQANGALVQDIFRQRQRSIVQLAEIVFGLPDPQARQQKPDPRKDARQHFEQESSAGDRRHDVQNRRIQAIGARPEGARARQRLHHRLPVLDVKGIILVQAESLQGVDQAVHELFPPVQPRSAFNGAYRIIPDRKAQAPHRKDQRGRPDEKAGSRRPAPRPAAGDHSPREPRELTEQRQEDRQHGQNEAKDQPPPLLTVQLQGLIHISSLPAARAALLFRIVCEPDRNGP